MPLRAVINLAGNGMATVLSALSLLLAARALGLADWGAAAAMLGLGQFLGGLLNWGTSVHHLREMSRATADQATDQAHRFYFVRLTTAAVVSIFGLILLPMWSDSGAVITLVGGTYASLGATIPFLARGRYSAAAALVVGEKAVAISSVATLAALNALTSSSLLVAIGTAGVLGLAVAAFSVARGCDRKISRKTSRPRDIVRQWAGSGYFALASIAPSALLLDIGVVSLVAGNAQAGIYGVGARLAGPLSVAATTIVQVLLPALSRTTPRSLRLTLTPRGVVAFGATCVFFSALAVLLPYGIIAVLGGEYAESMSVIRLFIVNAGMVLITRTLVTLLQAWRAERLAAILVAGQVVAALIWIAVAGWLGGADAAAWGLVLSNFLLAIALFVAVARLVGDRDSEE